MKKIFVLTGEPSGDKLASKVIAKIFIIFHVSCQIYIEKFPAY